MAADEIELPLDPDLDASPFAQLPRARWPRLRADVVAAVFAGGCVGGYARYAVTEAWPTASYAFPWSTLTVHLVGAFVLAVVVLVAAELAPGRYLRPLLGTGFCGALTTFSSVVVEADRMVAHGRPGTAAAYLAASVAGGLVAGGLGLVGMRALLAGRRAAREEGSTT